MSAELIKVLFWIVSALYGWYTGDESNDQTTHSQGAGSMLLQSAQQQQQNFVPNVPAFDYSDQSTGSNKRKLSSTDFSDSLGMSGGSGKPVVEAHTRPKTEVEEYKYDAKKKPPYAYTYLIYHAIKDMQKEKVTLGEIYGKIMEDYAYYRSIATQTAWKNSIRHNLTMHKSFVKIKRVHGDSGKGGYWRVDEEIASHEIAFEPKPVAQEGSKKKKKKKKKAKETPAAMPVPTVNVQDAAQGAVGVGVAAGNHFVAPQQIQNAMAQQAMQSNLISFPKEECLSPSPVSPSADPLSPSFQFLPGTSNAFNGSHLDGVSLVNYGESLNNPTGWNQASSQDVGLDEPALLKTLAAELGNDQPQNRLGKDLPGDLLGISSAFQASVNGLSGIFTGLSASFNGIKDNLSDSFAGVSGNFGMSVGNMFNFGDQSNTMAFS